MSSVAIPVVIVSILQYAGPTVLQKIPMLLSYVQEQPDFALANELDFYYIAYMSNNVTEKTRIQHLILQKLPEYKASVRDLLPTLWASKTAYQITLSISLIKAEIDR